MTSFTAIEKSGIYRVAPEKLDEAIIAAEASGLTVVTVALDDDDPMEAIAAAFAFPEWFGHNYDALEDSLCDLSWLPAERGWALMLSSDDATVPEERLHEVLEAATQWWPTQGKAFFVVTDCPNWPASLAIQG